jgi:hypothetical protein
MEQADALRKAMEGLPNRQHKMHPSSMQAILGLGSTSTLPEEAGSIFKPEVESIRPVGKTPFPPVSIDGSTGYRYYISHDDLGATGQDPRNLLEKERYVRETPPAMVRYHDEWTVNSQWSKRLQWDPTGSVFMGNPTLSEQMRGAYRGRPDSPNFDPIYADKPPWHKPALHSAPPKWESPEMSDRWPYGNET